MNEDDIYRTSSQYRFWSFSPEKLAALRHNTNAFAVDQVKDAIRRHRAREKEKINGSSNGDVNGTLKDAGVDEEVDCLTALEEKIIVDFCCAQCLKAGLDDPFRLPITVVATAVQYLKRFYLSNSPMNYHPKQIFPAALFLASKTETIHLSLPTFVEKLKSVGGFKKITNEEVLAPEFLITQALRFSFDVRHPQRAIKGVYMELLLLSLCVKGAIKSLPWIRKPMNQLIAELLRLQGPGHKNRKPSLLGSQKEINPILPRDFEKRIERAQSAARDITRKEALLSDAYFLYTPSQIGMAAYWIADAPLTEYYLSLKLDHPINVSNGDGGQSFLGTKKSRIFSIIKDCAAVLELQSSEQYENASEIDKKLKKARNPEKRDLVGLNAAQKRDAGGEGSLAESVVKKRKTEREKADKEGDELFGPPLVTREGPKK